MTSWALAWSSQRSGAEACLLELGLVLAHAVEVEHGLDVAQGGVEVLELVGVVGSGHAHKTTADGTTFRY